MVTRMGTHRKRSMATRKAVSSAGPRTTKTSAMMMRAATPEGARVVKSTRVISSQALANPTAAFMEPSYR